MDTFKSLKPLPCTLEKLNAVRLYLNVMTLADISNDCGKYIEAWALTGSRTAKAIIIWSNQDKSPVSY
eukprot:13215989-Ditylum_brightwellii.AAC.1